MNGLIRQYIPKKSDLASVSDVDVVLIMNRLNHRPRKCLDFLSPGLICRVVHQLAPLDENRIFWHPGSWPRRGSQCLLVVIEEVTYSKACAPRTSGYFSLETGFVALGGPTQ